MTEREAVEELERRVALAVLSGSVTLRLVHPTEPLLFLLVEALFQYVERVHAWNRVGHEPVIRGADYVLSGERDGIPLPLVLLRYTAVQRSEVLEMGRTTILSITSGASEILYRCRGSAVEVERMLCAIEKATPPQR